MTTTIDEAIEAAVEDIQENALYAEPPYRSKDAIDVDGAERIIHSHISPVIEGYEKIIREAIELTKLEGKKTRAALTPVGEELNSLRVQLTELKMLAKVNTVDELKRWMIKHGPEDNGYGGCYHCGKALPMKDKCQNPKCPVYQLGETAEGG